MTPTSWWNLPPDTGFGLHNLPFCRYSTAADEQVRVGVRFGDAILNAHGLVQGHTFAAGSLDTFFAGGPALWQAVRDDLQRTLTDERWADTVQRWAVPLSAATLHLPFEVADFVDFYASEQHAINAGRIFRPGQEPLPANWKHLPAGYHGRAGTVVLSGTHITRPQGQRRGPDGPVFGSSQKLDFEAEVGFVVGNGSPRGTSIGVDEFDSHVFGVVLVNDWSARDIQSWETVPLGPFLGKSFATSVSPWVVPLAALREAWIEPPPRTRPLFPYLHGGQGLALDLEVRLNGHVISRPSFASMYWTPAQLLAHLTVNGAATRIGDLFASGTVSGEPAGEWGSLLELTSDGAEPLTLDDDSTRTYLHDYDEISISATAPGAGGERICFGEVTGRIVPARED